MLYKMQTLFAEYPEVDLGALGFPSGKWQNEPLWSTRWWRKGLSKKNKRWGGLYPPHQRISKQSLPWKEEKTCHLTTPSPLHHLTLYLLYYTYNKVKLPVYPYKRMGVVSTATHLIFSFLGILLFIFSSLILSSKPHICAFHFFFAQGAISLETYTE